MRNEWVVTWRWRVLTPRASILLLMVVFVGRSFSASSADGQVQQPACTPALANAADHFGIVEASGLRWQHLSSRHGDLPVPGTSTEQTGSIVAALSNDGLDPLVVAVRPEG